MMILLTVDLQMEFKPVIRPSTAIAVFWLHWRWGGKTPATENKAIAKGCGADPPWALSRRIFREFGFDGRRRSNGFCITTVAMDCSMKSPKMAVDKRQRRQWCVFCFLAVVSAFCCLFFILLAAVCEVGVMGHWWREHWWQREAWLLDAKVKGCGVSIWTSVFWIDFELQTEEDLSRASRWNKLWLKFNF